MSAREILTNGLTWLAGGVTPAFVFALIAPVRKWLFHPPEGQQAYATAAIAAIFAASVSMIAVGLFFVFAPIGVTAVTFPQDGTAFQSQEDKHEFDVVALKEFPYCAISEVYFEGNYRPSHCQLIRGEGVDGRWKVVAGGNMVRCRVTCFQASFVK